MDTPDHIRIPLWKRNGEIAAYALIDHADSSLAAHRWHLGTNGYPARGDWSSGRLKIIRLHREVLGLEAGDGLIGDHINRDRLDNRRSNLRAVTPSGNGQNRPANKPSTSKFRGVCGDTRRGKWLAQVTVNYKHHFLGHFTSELGAAEVARNFRLKHMPYTVETDDPKARRAA